MKLNLLAIFCGCLILIGLLILIFDNEPDHRSVTVIKIDTLYLPQAKEPIIIEKLKGQFLRKSGKEDNLKFISSADTVIGKDTILISYSYPENYFNFEIYPAMDSIMVIRKDTEKLIQYNENWWENPLYTIIGFALGMIAGLFY